VTSVQLVPLDPLVQLQLSQLELQPLAQQDQVLALQTLELAQQRHLTLQFRRVLLAQLAQQVQLAQRVTLETQVQLDPLLL
jgi:hypothetical protein